jgi:photosystem II stability/assembly factor-like uncharacterized protein
MSIIFQQVIAQNNGVLALNVGTDAPVDPVESQGLLIDAAGAIYATTSVPPTHYVYGLPFDDNGRLVVEAAAISYYDQGLPFTANGALAGENDVESGYYSQGVFFGASGAIAVTGLTPDPPNPPNTWTALSLGAPGDLTGVASDGDQLFVAVGVTGFASRSQDGGQTWETMVQGLNSGSTTVNFTEVACAPDGTIIVVSASGFNSRSLDGGDTWEAIPASNFSDGFDQLVVCETNGNGHWLVAAQISSDTWYSSDNGDTWTKNDSIPGSSGTEFRGGCFVFGTENTFLLAADNGLAVKTEDGGATYERFLPQGLASGTNENLRDAAAIGNTLVFQTGDAVFNSISFDGGDTWDTAPIFFNSGNGAFIQVGSIASDGYQTFISGQQSGFAAMSSDAGLTWSALPQYLGGGATSEWTGVATNRQGVWVVVGRQNRASLGTFT